MDHGLDSAPPSHALPTLDVGIQIEYADKVTFALQQYGVPLVSKVSLTNHGAAALRGIEIAVAIENGEAATWFGRIERLDTESTYSLEPTEFRLMAAKLAARTEAERSVIVVTVTAAAAAVTKSFPIDLLAFDQWPGTGVYPELLAAFITPNHPNVAEILSDARLALGKLSGRDALDGYQSASRQRIAHIAEACFNATLARGIGYINPPASFDREGQRVRLVDRVCRERLGSCLDLSLFLASLWEQAGLHPLIVLLEGHAIPAVWTHEAHLPEPTIEDAAHVRNLIELGEIVPVESTLLTQAGATFTSAVVSAKQRIASPGSVFCSIDVCSSRKRGVRPLPLRAGSDATALDLDTADPSRIVATPGADLDRITLAERAARGSPKSQPNRAQETGADRIGRWQSRLLDLSLVNRLINFRETGRTVQLRVPKVGPLENLLADGERLAIHAKVEGEEQFFEKELQAHRLFTTEAPAETQKRLLVLYRTAKATIEETGANPLYMAIGMLKWFETEGSDTVRRAPMILLPARLQRSAAGAGYRYDVSLSEEPLRANVTLLEKLRSEFGIDIAALASMPEDEQGLDVDLILRNFRSAIRDMRRWEVEESVFLGLFSFNKFLMWRDLQENMDKLKQNRLVRHLVDRAQTEFDGEPLPRPDDLDDRVKPGDLFCTRDADSTQLSAIRAAAENRTFVLEGPPGTGKSQTIANIIADSIGRGKRVLFVAEKMAALSVVRDRLEKDGIGPFCLELHSAKASKKEVLGQLEAGLNAKMPALPEGWTAQCDELAQTRDQLNAYVRAMHERRATGETLHQVLGRLIRLGDGPRAALGAGDLGNTNKEQLDLWRRHIMDVTKRLEAVDPVHEHPLRGVGRSQWSFGLMEECRDALSNASVAIDRLSSALASFGKSVHGGGDLGQLGRNGIEAVLSVVALCQQGKSAHQRLIVGADAPALVADIRSVCEVGKQRDFKRASLLECYREEFLQLDHLKHIDAVTRAAELPPPFRMVATMRARRALRPYCAGAVPTLATLRADLEAARDVKQISTRLASRGDLAELLGPSWNGGNANWADVEGVLQWCEQLRKALDIITREPGGRTTAQALAEACSDAASRDAMRAAAASALATWKVWVGTWSTVKRLLSTSTERVLATGDGKGWLPVMRAVFARWTKALPELNNWCVWRHARDSAAKVGLGDLMDTLERGHISRSNLSDVFERSFGERWFNTLANSCAVVRDFNGPAQNAAILHFRGLDKALIDATRRVISATLAETMPAASSASSPQSELGVLRRELQKKRRHLPTRRLIETIPNLIARLKPCFLMSPLSVAQYLDAKLPPFDLVVFDEASQIPAWDAIGAIARGTEVIVVGDSKQLPPTSFFSTVDGEDDEPAQHSSTEDVESILQECTASGIPAMWLGWHYRSKHESLIAFSNHFYYQNRLHTFPSPSERSAELGVTLRHVPDGVYDKGGSRTNRIEASRVVDEVVRLLTSSEVPDSLGIVTFNQAQQLLIEDLLDQRRREHPAIERFFTNEVPEAVFIKNLENVQGDERDTIIFSVGYGVDQTGNLSMNFGPLNQDGGERRLNVAVTRARKRLIVYSSLRSDQIDLRRTQAVGVKHFKTFLDYAERGPRAIAEAVDRGGSADFESGFEHAVWSALTARGLSVDTQVGCAGYRVDLAVRDPGRPGRYLLGIECDGAAYHSAKTARDRDRLRQSVLEGLGWRIHRVWSTEWRVNPERCLQQIDHALEVAKKHQPDTEQNRSETTAAVAAPTERTVVLPNTSPDGLVMSGASNSLAPASHPTISTLAAEHSSRVTDQYRCASPIPLLDSLDVFDASASLKAIEALGHIIDSEGPIVEELALRRLASWFGVQRVTDRFRARFATILAHALVSGRTRGPNDVLWPSGLNESTYTGFRVPGAGDDARRELDLVPLCERANAVVATLEQQFGLPREELEREVAGVFGFLRVTTRARELIGEAIALVVASGRATESGDQVSLVVRRP